MSQAVRADLAELKIFLNEMPYTDDISLPFVDPDDVKIRLLEKLRQPVVLHFIDNGQLSEMQCRGLVQGGRHSPSSRKTPPIPRIRQQKSFCTQGNWQPPIGMWAPN